MTLLSLLSTVPSHIRFVLFRWTGCTSSRSVHWSVLFSGNYVMSAVLFSSTAALSAVVHWTDCPRSRGSTTVQFNMVATMAGCVTNT